MREDDAAKGIAEDFYPLFERGGQRAGMAVAYVTAIGDHPAYDHADDRVGEKQADIAPDEPQLPGIVAQPFGGCRLELLDIGRKIAACPSRQMLAHRTDGFRHPLHQEEEVFGPGGEPRQYAHDRQHQCDCYDGSHEAKSDRLSDAMVRDPDMPEQRRRRMDELGDEQPGKQSRQQIETHGPRKARPPSETIRWCRGLLDRSMPPSRSCPLTGARVRLS